MKLSIDDLLQTIVKGLFLSLESMLLMMIVVSFFPSRLDLTELSFIILWVLGGHFLIASFLQLAYRKILIRKKEWLLVIAFVTFAFTFFYPLRGYDPFIWMLSIVLLAFMWKQALAHDTTHKEVKIKFEVIVALTILYTYFAHGSAARFPFFEISLRFFPFYVLSGFLYLYQMNMISVYNDSESNTMNKKRNISRFNRIWMGTLIVIFIFMQTRFIAEWVMRFFSLIFNAITRVLYFLLMTVGYPLVWIFDKLFEYLLRAVALFRSEMHEIVSELAPPEMPDFQEVEEVVQMSDGFAFLLNALTWLFFISIGLFFILKAYKSLNRKKEDPSSTETIVEEKAFVFNYKEVLKDLMKPLKKLEERIFNKKFDGLPEVRKLYIQYLSYYETKNKSIHPAQTPNEYYHTLNNGLVNLSLFEKLTGLYNKVRYGDKTLDIAENKEVKNIKMNSNFKN